MKTRKVKESPEELEKIAHTVEAIRPLSPAMKREWEAALRTGARLRAGRPRKDPKHKSRIIPISIAPHLLEKIDKFAKASGLTRSRLVAEGLELRMKPK